MRVCFFGRFAEGLCKVNQQTCSPVLTRPDKTNAQISSARRVCTHIHVLSIDLPFPRSFPAAFYLPFISPHSITHFAKLLLPPSRLRQQPNQHAHTHQHQHQHQQTALPRYPQYLSPGVPKAPTHSPPHAPQATIVCSREDAAGQTARWYYGNVGAGV